jgi:hypothetical protein
MNVPNNSKYYARIYAGFIMMSTRMDLRAGTNKYGLLFYKLQEMGAATSSGST